MSERTPKQPLNDPEYTVPEYSVLLPSDEAKNSTAASPDASNNVAPSGTAESNTAEDNASGGSASEHASTPSQTTTGYTAPVSSEQVIPERPKAMRSVIRCATAIIMLQILSVSLMILLPMKSYIDFERVVNALFYGLVFTFIISIIPIFILWKVWDGREWARILTIIGNVFAAANGVLIFANEFMDSRYFSGLMNGSLSSSSREVAVSHLVGAVISVIMIALHVLMIVLLTRAPIRTYTQIVSGARALEHQQMMSETRQAAGQVPAELRELFADDEDGERTSSERNNPRPPHRRAGWGT